MGFDRHWQLWKWHTRRKYSAASAEQGPRCGDEAMENTFYIRTTRVLKLSYCR